MEGVKNNRKYKEKEKNDDYFVYKLKMIIYSLIGICIFFIPVKIDNQVKTILYHIVDTIQLNYNNFLQISILVFILLSTLKEIKNQNKSKLFIFSKLLSIIILINIFYGQEYLFFKNDNTILVIKEIILNIITILPVCSIFMPFILNYGLMDIVESYCHVTMKNLFKVSGKTVLNILLFLFTDYFCGYYVLNYLYVKGKIRQNEFYMILLNFSIMSFTMIKYICGEINLNNKSFIFTFLFILIVANMIICRIYPLNKIKKSYFVKTNYKETTHKKDKFKKGVTKHLQSKEDEKLILVVLDNLEYAINISLNLIFSIVIVFFLGDMLFSNDYIVSAISKVFYPIINLLKLEEGSLIAKSMVLSFYNDIIAIDSLNLSLGYTTRFLISILLVLGGTSLSSNIAYFSNTQIEINKKFFIYIYIERILLILFLYSAIYYFYSGYIM